MDKKHVFFGGNEPKQKRSHKRPLGWSFSVRELKLFGLFKRRGDSAGGGGEDVFEGRKRFFKRLGLNAKHNGVRRPRDLLCGGDTGAQLLGKRVEFGLPVIAHRNTSLWPHRGLQGFPRRWQDTALS